MIKNELENHLKQFCATARTHCIEFDDINTSDQWYLKTPPVQQILYTEINEEEFHIKELLIGIYFHQIPMNQAEVKLFVHRATAWRNREKFLRRVLETHF